MAETTKEVTHTPGPWTADWTHSTRCAITGHGWGNVGTVAVVLTGTGGVMDYNRDTAAANARLIAAAPALLAALKWFADFAGEPCKPGEFGANCCQHRDCETIRAARAAIAKAEGR